MLELGISNMVAYWSWFNNFRTFLYLLPLLLSFLPIFFLFFRPSFVMPEEVNYNELGVGDRWSDQTVTICQFSPRVSTLFSQWISLTSIKSWYLTSHEPVDSSKLYTLIICSLLYDNYTSVKLFIQKSKKWKVVLLHGGLSFFCEAHTPLSSIRN